MEKEAIEQLLNSNDIEDVVLGIIISEKLGIEMFTSSAEEHEPLYAGYYKRDHPRHPRQNPSYGTLIIDRRFYWFNHIGIYKARESRFDLFLKSSSPVLYNDGSIKEYQEYP